MTVEFSVGWESYLDLEGCGSIKHRCIYEFLARCVCGKDFASLLLIYLYHFFDLTVVKREQEHFNDCEDRIMKLSSVSYYRVA